jgi:hypothetical protein
MTISLAFVAWVATVAFHVALCRLPGLRGPVTLFAVAALTGGVCLAAVLGQIWGMTAESVGALLAFAFGCELYLFLVTLSFASVSANILTRLLSGQVAASQLDAAYSGEGMSEQRVDRLKLSGLVEDRQGRLILTKRGAIIVGTIVRLRRLFGHEPRTTRIVRNNERWVAAATALTFFVLMIAPAGATLWTDSATALFEEAIGYRFFYGLRILFGKEQPWLPQGQTLGVIQHLFQLALSAAGFAVNDVGMRIKAFVGLNAVCFAALSSLLLYKLCRDVTNVFSGIAIVSFLYVMMNGSTAELWWYSYPDYPLVTLIVAIISLIWTWRLVTKRTVSLISTNEAIIFGLFAGTVAANKITNIVYPVTLGLVYLTIYHRNVYRLFISATVSLFAAWITISIFYLNILSPIMYINGLKIFLLSQIHSTDYDSVVGFLVRWTFGEPQSMLFLMPAFVAAGVITGLFLPKYRSMLAFIPGIAFIEYFLYQRFYSWSTIEAYLFAWFSWSMLFLLTASGYRRLFSIVVAIVATFGALVSAHNLTKRSREALQTYSAFNVGYTELAKDIAGKRVLNLTSGNAYRIESTFSSMCKGGTDIFNPTWGDSKFLTRQLPLYSCAVRQNLELSLYNIDAIIFRQLLPEDANQAIRRNEEYFSVSLDKYNCNTIIPVPDGSFVACFVRANTKPQIE